MDLRQLGQRIKDGYRIGAAEASALSRLGDKGPLYALADELRRHFRGNRLDTCSIMNARSGRCSEDCRWCSQSKYHRTDIEVYPLVGEEAAVEMGVRNAAEGIGRFSLVTSGRALSDAEVDRACAIYRRLGREARIGLCASMGLLTLPQLRRLKESGVERYHCNLETAPSYFPRLCTTHTAEEKLRTLAWAKEAGLEICSGGIIGMGETAEHRIELALKLREIGAVSVPVNILNPIRGTALEGAPPLKDEEVLTAFALFRIIHPEADIRFAGGRLLIRHIQEKALRGGVNAVMMGDLLTTPGAQMEEDRALFRRCGYAAD